MPRKARLNVTGSVVHIMARTLPHEQLFSDDDDCDQFLAMLSKSLVRVGYRCYAWALMPNHYHLIVRTSDRELWEFMKPLNTGYAGYHRKKYLRDGPLFRDRYKSIVTQDQHYIAELVRYVHLNPVRAGICKDLKALEQHPWTGNSALMGKHKYEFQDVNTVLQRFGATMASARRAYRAFLQEGLDNDCNKDELTSLVRASNTGTQAGRKTTNWVIGDQAFVKKALLRADEVRIRISRFEKEGSDLAPIAAAVAARFKVRPVDLKNRSRANAVAEARKVFAWLAIHEYRAPTRMVAAYCGVGMPAAWAMARAGQVLAGEHGFLK